MFLNLFLNFNRVEEIWHPTIEGLDELKVVRELPAVLILLSLDPLDPTLPGLVVVNDKM